MLAPLPPLPGFRLQSYLGSGPSGHVYRAYDELHRRDVAIKLLDPRRCTRWGLARLIEIAARAATSPVARADRRYEVVTDPLRPFVVMDLLPGESLQSMLLCTGPMAWKKARAIAHAIAVALEAAHDIGVVHGAIKPTNIFVQDNFVTLTDFGIRSLPDPLDADALLADAERMAPEQLRGEAPDARTDLYGLGLVLFELVTGQLPFAGRPREVFKQQLSRRPPAPSSIVPTLAPEADTVLLELLDKNPTRRPSSASRVRGMLSVAERGQEHEGSTVSRVAWRARDRDTSLALAPAKSQVPSPRARPAHFRTLAAAVLATALGATLVTTCL